MLYIYTYLNVLFNSVKEEKGQGMAEYGLILALIAVVVIGALFALGGQLDDIFNDLETQIANPGG